MKYKVVFVFIICAILLQNYAECKRSGGRSKSSSSRGSTGLWGSNSNKKKGSGNSQPKPQPNPDAVALSYPKQSVPAPKPKPSAPKLETQRVQKPVATAPQGNQKPIGFDNVNKPAGAGTGTGAATVPGSNVQSNQQKPIGWNVQNKDGQGQMQSKTVATNQQSAPPSYGQPGHAQGAPPPYNPNPHPQGAPPAYSAGGYGQGAPPAYGGGGYGQGAPPQYSAGGYGHGAPPAYNQGGYPHGAPPAYSANGYGGAPPPYSAGGYQPGYGNYHGAGQMGQMGPPSYGSHGYSNGGGMFGSSYGGKPGFGHGGMGMGGFGGYGGYGGMMGPKKSFGSGFARTAFTSIATGLLVWSLMRGGRSHYYNVYNHYNNPEAVPQDITLPANVITLCAEDVSSLCAANTVPLCTANETILCAVTAAATVPCVDNSGTSCVDTSLPCTKDCGDTNDNATLSLPCIANATVNGQVNLGENSGTPDSTMSLFKQTSQNSETVLCVTAMAMPNPEEEKAAQAAMQANASTDVSVLKSTENIPESTSALPSER